MPADPPVIQLLNAANVVACELLTLVVLLLERSTAVEIGRLEQECIAYAVADRMQ
jgi:hypothetical protein